MEKNLNLKQTSKFKDYFISALIGTTLGLTLSFAPEIIINKRSEPTFNKLYSIATEVNYTINDCYLPEDSIPEVILIGDIHGKKNKQIGKILENLVSDNDEILIECSTTQTNLEEVVKRDYLRDLLRGGKLKNISIMGTDDSLLVKESLTAVDIMDISNYYGVETVSRAAMDYLLSIAYERDRFSFSPKIIDSVKKNRIKNNSIKNIIKLNTSSESYQIIGSLHLEMDEIRKNLKKEGVSYISLIPKIESKKDSMLFKERKLNAQEIYNTSKEYFDQAKSL